MSAISSFFGNIPGMGSLTETFEQAFAWGPYPRYYGNGYISASTSDPGNSPTWELRPGLVLGQQIATGQWVNYNATNTDGSEVAAGVLVQGLRMQDVLSGVNTVKFYAIMVSGGVQGSKLIGLDQQARAQMAQLFYFDDNLPGNHVFPWRRFQTKTANYSIVASDNLSQFNTFGATGAVTFTLPPIANGYYFGFSCEAAQNMAVSSFEGGNIIALNNLVANTLTFSTGGQLISGNLVFYTNPAGTKWICENRTPGVAAISVS